MKRLASSQAFNLVDDAASSSSSTIHKNQLTDGTRKSKLGLSTNKTLNISHRHDTHTDVSEDEADEPVPKKKRKVSIIHSYANKLSDKEYQCTLCPKIIRCCTTSNANVKRHLINVHDLHHLQSKNDQSQSSEKFDTYRKRVLDEAAINCIITDNRSFGDFRKSGMTQFLSKAIPGYTGPHANTVTRRIKKLYSMKLSELQEELNSVSYVSLTTDLWKRPKGHHYMCVTIHYVDQYYQNITKVLSFRRFHGRHLSTRIRRHLHRVVGRFGLESKIVATVTDNGSDVRAAVQQSDKFGIRLYCLCHGLNLTMKNGLQLWKKEDSKKNKPIDLTSPHDDQQHLKSNVDGNKENLNDALNEDERLNVDIEDDEEETSSTLSSITDDDEMNFSVEEDDFDETGGNEDEELRHDMDIVSSDDEMDNEIIQTSKTSFNTENISNILYNCRKIVNIINKSSILYEITQKLARPSIKCQLTIDMRIRWHSTCTMVSKFVAYQDILNQLMNQLPSIQGVRIEQKNQLVKLQLSNTQWEIINILEDVLLLFSEGSDMLSGNKYPSYAVAYLVIDSLYFYLQSDTPDPIEKQIKETLNEAFDGYVYRTPGSPEHNLMLVCAFLNPEVYDSMNDLDKASAKKLLTAENNKKNNVTLSTTCTSTTSYSIGDNASNKTIISNAERLKRFRAKCGIVEEAQESVRTKHLTFRQELTKFELLEKTDHTFKTFWKKYETSLPALSRMARRYGCVPASSVPSESSFSVAGHIATKTRSSISARNLKYCMFLKDKI